MQHVQKIGDKLRDDAQKRKEHLENCYKNFGTSYETITEANCGFEWNAYVESWNYSMDFLCNPYNHINGLEVKKSYTNNNWKDFAGCWTCKCGDSICEHHESKCIFGVIT